MDHPALATQRTDPAVARPVFKLMFLAQLGFVAVSLCLSIIGGYFAGTVSFVNALVLFVASGAVATLAWRYVGSEVKRLSDVENLNSPADNRNGRASAGYLVR